ncbi:ORF47 [Ostreid herpesvirus 1]|nr:ORF47 [Ostreid herpesvirus 1]AVL26975.1 ORF47 [Ostreid herpesvirus 1]
MESINVVNSVEDLPGFNPDENVEEDMEVVESVKNDLEMSDDEELELSLDLTGDSMFTPPPSKRKREELSDSMKQRVNYYAIADMRMKDECLDYIKNSTYANEGWTEEMTKEFLINQSMTMKLYLETPCDADKLREYLHSSFSDSEVFGIINMANVGDAGTGKTRCMINFQSSMPGMCITGPENKTTIHYSEEYMNRNQPGCRRFEKSTCTWHKFLNLMFANTTMQIQLKKLQDDEELNKETESFVNDVSMLGSPEELRKRTRELTLLYMVKLRNIMTAVYDQMKYNFTKEKMEIYRPMYDNDSPMNQDDKMTFTWVNNDFSASLKRLNTAIAMAEQRLFGGAGQPSGEIKVSKTLEKILKKQISDLKEERRLLILRHALSKNIKTQEEYRNYVSFMTSEKRAKFAGGPDLPPMTVIYEIVMAEEDGKTPLYMKFLHSMISTVANMIYNPPYYKIRPPIYFTSGSDTQFGSISSTASPLSYILSPAIKSDEKHTMVWRGQLFRRGLDDMSSDIAKAHRVPCLRLENNLPLDESILKLWERHSTLLGDPDYHPESVRIFATHNSINQFTNKMKDSGRADLYVNDLAMISSNVVPLEGSILSSGGINSKNGINTIELSTKSETEAKKARCLAWKKKMVIYSNKIKKRVKNENKPEETKLEIKPRKVVVKGVPMDANRIIPSSEEYIDRRTGGGKECAEVNIGYTRYSEALDVEMAKTLERLNMDYKKDLAIAYGSKEAVEAEEKMLKENEDMDGLALLKTKNVNNRAKMVVESISSCKTGSRKRKHEDIVKEHEAEKRDSDDEDDFEEVDVEDTYSPTKNITTMMYITGPAKELLSKDEHIEHRMYAGNIEKKLGQGKTYAKQVFTSARATDHLGIFEYVPEGDMVTIYGNVDVKAYDKDDMATFYKSVEKNISGVVMHMTFKRPRAFTSNRKVDMIRNNMTLIPRGVESTPMMMRMDGAYNNGSIASMEMKFLVNMEIVFEFLKEKIMYHMQTLIHNKMDDGELTDIFNQLFEYDGSSEMKLVANGYREAMKHCKNENKKEKGKKMGVEDLYKDSICWINCIQMLDMNFFENRKLTIYLHKSPLYDIFKYASEKSVSISANDVTFKSTIIGNYRHEALFHVVDKAIGFKPDFKKNGCGFGYEFKEEDNLDQKDRHKGDHMAMEWAMKHVYPELFYSTSAVVKYGDVMIMSSEPKMENPINWTELFCSEERKQWGKHGGSNEAFGVLARRFQAPPSTPDTILFNQKYRLPIGEGVGFPRPFRQGAGPKNSGVILKSKNKVLYYASNAAEFTDMGYDKKQAKAESGYALGMVCPFTISEAFTFHHAQGSTLAGGVFIDLGKLKNGNGELIHGMGGTSSAVLVGITRPTEVSNVKLANVEEFKKAYDKEAQTKDWARTLAKKRIISSVSTRFEKFKS